VTPPVVDAHLMRLDAADIAGYLPRVRALLDAPAADVEVGGGRKVSGSPAPWNEFAAGWLFEVHAGVREAADWLSRVAYGRRWPLGGSDAVTLVVLGRLPDLAAAVASRGLGQALPGDTAQQLARWAREGRRLLGEPRVGEERPSRAPGGLACPHCSRALWLAPGWRERVRDGQRVREPVYCRVCLDENGRPLSWPASAWVGALQDRPEPGPDAGDRQAGA